MFIIVVSSAVFFCCAIVIWFLKTSPEKLHHQQISSNLIDDVTFLRSIKSTKPFPISAVLGWKVYIIRNGLRVWHRNIIVDNSSSRIEVIGCFTKLPASTQFVCKLLKDVKHFHEWRPGTEQVTQVVSEAHDSLRTLSHDLVTLVTANHDSSLYSIVVDQRSIGRYWNREDNGCFWLLESSSNILLYFIVQPVEELECCCLTVVIHSQFPVSIATCTDIVSSYAVSLKDYLTHRKMKVTPLLKIHIPQMIVDTTFDNDLSDSSTDSSGEDTENTFFKKFVGLNPRKKTEVLEKGNIILRTRSYSQRSDSDRNNQVRQRSATLPHNTSGAESMIPHVKSLTLPQERSAVNKNKKINHEHCLPSVNSLENEVFFESSNPVNTQTSNSEKHNNAKKLVQKSDENNQLLSYHDDVQPLSDATQSSEANGAIVDNVPCSTKVPNSDSGVDLSSQKFHSKPESEVNREKADSKNEEQKLASNVRLTTLANQSAADLLAEYLNVSNIDLKKPISQQSALSGGWTFSGLENDVVILKKIPAEGSNIISYMGKGLIHAAPQTVLETVKNPRTKFTYDETLKKVDILNDITENIKIVYYYHEVINLFRKSCYDFCVLQTERQDGDKYVLANASVDNGLPVPVGVQRSQMFTSGWVIEPVNKDKKISSMTTFILQIDYGTVKSTIDKALMEEVVAKQAISIAYLRQFLRPAKWVPRPQSSPSHK